MKNLTFWSIIFFTLFSQVALSQKGEITFQVIDDNSGIIITDAKIALTNRATKNTKTNISNNTLIELEVGNYEVVVNAAFYGRYNDKLSIKTGDNGVFTVEMTNLIEHQLQFIFL